MNRVDDGPTTRVIEFSGLRSFVPRHGVILKLALASLAIGPDYLMITTIGPPWTVVFADISAIVIDRKAVLVRKRDGISARFKASRVTIQAVQREFETRGVDYSMSARSTYFEVNALPRDTA
jgi:hypothetical protein